MLSKIRSLVSPRFEMPPQTCTLRGCFGLPFRFGYSHSQWNEILVWFSSTTLHSSVKVTSSNCSSSCKHFWLNSRCLMQFGSMISWQYFVLVHTQSSFCLRRLIFGWENLVSNWSLIPLVSSGTVILSFLSILVSRKFIVSKVTSPVGWPLLGAFSSNCLSW